MFYVLHVDSELITENYFMCIYHTVLALYLALSDDAAYFSIYTKAFKRLVSFIITSVNAF